MNVITKYDNKLIRLNTDKLNFIGCGYESNVYTYKDIALKIHRDNYITKVGLSYDMVKNFKKISTQRILMPQNLIYKCSNIFPKYIGYTTKLIDNIKNKAEITNIDSNHLYNEISKLKSDINILSSNKIFISDILFEDNLVFNDNIYFVDPRSFYYDKNSTVEQISFQNIKELNFILYYYLFCMYEKQEYIENELKFMNNIDFNQNINLNTDMSAFINYLYKQQYKKDFSIDKMDHINNIIKILEKYGSIQNYKYSILKEFISNKSNNLEYVKTIKKIVK